MRKKNVIRYLAGSICFLLAVILTLSVHTLFGQILAGASLASSLILFSDSTGGKKVFHVLKKAVRGFFARIENFFSGKIMGHYEGTRLTMGYRDEISFIKKEKRKKRKPGKKYKDMDNRERIRYFYGRMITAQRKKGGFYSVTYTPLEIQKAWEKQKKLPPAGKELFACYNGARYDDNREISDAEVEKARESVKKK